MSNLNFPYLHNHYYIMFQPDTLKIKIYKNHWKAFKKADKLAKKHIGRKYFILETISGISYTETESDPKLEVLAGYTKFNYNTVLNSLKELKKPKIDNSQIIDEDGISKETKIKLNRAFKKFVGAVQ